MAITTRSREFYRTSSGGKRFALSLRRHGMLCLYSLVLAAGCKEGSGSAPGQAALPPSAPSPTFAAVGPLGSVWESLNGTIAGASRTVQERVGPPAEAIQSRTQEEVEKLFRWEYKVVDFPLVTTSHELEESLSKLGADGWECVSFLPHDARIQVTCKRRPRSALDYLRYVPGL